MAVTIGGAYNMYAGTAAQYKALQTKDENALYYLEDTKELYVGSTRYCDGFEVVADFPESGAQGRLYIHETTKEVKFYNGTAWTTLVPAIETTIDTESDVKDGNLATIGAIKALVESKDIPDATEEVKGKVQLATNAEAFAGEDTTKVITPANLKYAIEHNIVGAVTYKGAVAKEADITLPVQAGDLFAVSADFTLATVKLYTGDFIIFNKEVAETITKADFDVIDNTESTDLVKLDAEQTLTNKTIDAENNTISNITTGNLKDSVLVTDMTAEVTDEMIPSAKAVKDAITGAQVSVESTDTVTMTKDESGKIKSDVKLDTTGNVTLTSTENGIKAELLWKAIPSA